MMRLLVDFLDADRASKFWQWASKRINNMRKIARLEGSRLMLSEKAWREWHAKMFWLAVASGWEYGTTMMRMNVSSSAQDAKQ